MNNNKVPDSLSETKIQYYFQQDQDKVFHGVIPNKFFQNIRLEDLRQILPTPRKDEYLFKYNIKTNGYNLKIHWLNNFLTEDIPIPLFEGKIVVEIAIVPLRTVIRYTFIAEDGSVFDGTKSLGILTKSPSYITLKDIKEFVPVFFKPLANTDDIRYFFAEYEYDKIQLVRKEYFDDATKIPYLGENNDTRTCYIMVPKKLVWKFWLFFGLTYFYVPICAWIITICLSSRLQAVFCTLVGVLFTIMIRPFLCVHNKH